MFDYGASLDGSRRQSATVNGDGVVHEEFDPDGAETDGSWASGSVSGHFAQGRTERRAPRARRQRVRLPRGATGRLHRVRSCRTQFLRSVTDGEHGRNLRRYRRGTGNSGSPLSRAHLAGMPREKLMVAGEVLDSVLTLAVLSFMQIFDNPTEPV